MSFKISVIGTGYVGLVTGTCFASTGNNVWCVDILPEKIEMLKKGIPPIFEPGLDRLLQRNLDEGRLNFTTSLEDAVLNTSIIFLCLPTPPNEDGSADLQHVKKVAKDIAVLIKSKSITEEIIVINKSTVPVGTGDEVEKIFAEVLGKQNNVTIASNPEFLREGFAVEDALKPERIVIGTDNNKVSETLRDLYSPFVRSGNPIFIMDRKSAEVTKYAANSFLAVKISFMNDLSVYCEKVGADIEKIRIGIGSDTRIGKRFLFAGIGYGGSCFPKDVKALIHSSGNMGVDLKLVKAAEEVNRLQTQRFIDTITSNIGGDVSGKTIALWGLAFKPNTDDTREAPAFMIIEQLLQKGAIIKSYDPEAMPNTKLKFGDSIEYCSNQYDCIKGADVLVIATEWNLFRNPDFKFIKNELKSNIIFDGRNLFDPVEMANLGFEYHCIGRNFIKPN